MTNPRIQFQAKWQSKMIMLNLRSKNTSLVAKGKCPRKKNGPEYFCSGPILFDWTLKVYGLMTAGVGVDAGATELPPFELAGAFAGTVAGRVPR